MPLLVNCRLECFWLHITKVYLHYLFAYFKKIRVYQTFGVVTVFQLRDSCYLVGFTH
jgi:hypothetical protein